MSWFKKARRPIATPVEPSRVPEGLWVKCPSCSKILYEKDLEKNLRVCGS
ncbi:MAG: acetyl-CoA carboxylase carboxyl transferase subunit beta, partial [Acidobacteria bacterium]|nr:acetyl-CoA carboxylase carboxyl transferase subunit beta [Acidobacteriota bacterium]